MAQEAVSRSCRRWMCRAPTDSLEGTKGVLDHYARAIEVPAGQDADVVFERLEERLLRYRIFPPRIMRAEVCSIDGRVREGTTIVQHVAVGPFPLEAAVRVIGVWRSRDGDADEIGFTYVTLEGHPERGISTFRIRRSQREGITFLIDARSRPGTLLTRLARPLARRLQRRWTQRALSFFSASSD